jgi:hypothetical protein
MPRRWRISISAVSAEQAAISFVELVCDQATQLTTALGVLAR